MGQPHEEFPAEQIIEGGTALTINGKELKNIIKNTAYAASRDDLKPVLQGVLFEVGKDGFISVATDGHRLVKYEKTNIQAQDYVGSVVVPAKFLTLLNNQLEDNDTTPILVGENHIQIQLINGTIMSRTIKDPYPDYEGVIPKENSNTLIVDKGLLEEAIKRVSIFSNKSSRQISLNISDNNMIISTEDPENITSGKETLECDYDGDPITIGYNALYLREVLQHQGSSEIKIMLETPLNAGLFLPIEQKDNEHKTTLLMPIRLND
jgi:DNA polymerase-3 subunit beta